MGDVEIFDVESGQMVAKGKSGNGKKAKNQPKATEVKGVSEQLE